MEQSFDTHHSLLNDTLELCPNCGEKQLLPLSPAALIQLCLGCGSAAATDRPKPPSSGKVHLRGPETAQPDACA
jgi:hypothetical protein